MNKLLVVTGPTATGKTSLGIEFAKKFNGEIISADSRQVYRGMDIGTGKDKDEYAKNGVTVWGIDLVDPDYNFNVSDYVEYASKAIRDIQARGKLPIVVGGTVLYIKALLDPFETIGVPPNESLRSELNKLSVEELQTRLQERDPGKWQRMNDSDRRNQRRLIRAIEVASTIEIPNTRNTPNFSNKCLIISLTASFDFLYRRIDARVDERVKQGAVEEVKALLEKGYTEGLPSMSATGYKEFAQYFADPSPETRNQKLETSVQRWKFNEHSYARRQVSFINKFLTEQQAVGVRVLEANIETSGWRENVFELAAEWYTKSDVQTA